MNSNSGLLYLYTKYVEIFPKKNIEIYKCRNKRNAFVNQKKNEMHLAKFKDGNALFFIWEVADKKWKFIN